MAFLLAAESPPNHGGWQRASDYALAHNPDARIAQQRIAAAQAGLEQANSTFWPRLQSPVRLHSHGQSDDGFCNISTQWSYSSSLNFNDVPGVDDLNARGIVTVPLYAGGRNVAGRQAARANTEAAKQESAAVGNALGFEVSRAFHTVLKTRQFIQAAEAAVNSFETTWLLQRSVWMAAPCRSPTCWTLKCVWCKRTKPCLRPHANSLAERALRNLLGIEDGEFIVADTAPVVSAPNSGDFAQRPERTAARARESANPSANRRLKERLQPRVSALQRGLRLRLGDRW